MRETEPGKVVPFRVMTYNVRHCRGRDGKVDVARVAAVINEQRPDVACLQELDVRELRSHSTDQPGLLASLTDTRVHFHAARQGRSGSFGNATLCRSSFELLQEGQLPRLRDEARAAHCLEVSLGSSSIHVINTHLSVRLRERLQQVQAILADEAPLESAKGLFSAMVAPYARLVFCGDLNAGGWSPVVRWLRPRLHDVTRGLTRARRATFPSGFPVLGLDHIWVGPAVSVVRAFVATSALSRVASDHLPLVADLRIRAESPGDWGPKASNPARIVGTTSQELVSGLAHDGPLHCRGIS